MQKIIEFEDKVALNENSSIPEINKVTDDNINEIKSIVNGSLQGTNAMGSIVVDDVSCKNMLNKNVFSNSYLNNGVETSSPQSALFNYIQVKPNTQYTFSSSSSIRYLAIYEFNDTKTYLTTQLSENTSNYSFTTGNNTKYIRIDINKDASAIMTQLVIDTLTPQFELGSTATTYTPYKAFKNEEVYSTNEMVVGTWIDGKPIYRKVVTGTASSTSGGDVTVPFTCDTLIKFEPFLIAGDSILPLNFYNDANTRGLCYKSGNNILVRVWGNQYFLGKDFYIILEYTKTTSGTRSIEMEENNDNR